MWLRPMIRDLLDLLAGQAADPRVLVREAREVLLRLVARAAAASYQRHDAMTRAEAANAARRRSGESQGSRRFPPGA